MAIERIPLIDNKAIVVCPSTSIFFVPQDEIQFRSFLMTIIVIAAPRGVTCHIDDDDDDDDDDLFCQHVSRMQMSQLLQWLWQCQLLLLHMLFLLLLAELLLLLLLLVICYQ